MYYPVDVDKEYYLQHFMFSLLTGDLENEKPSNMVVKLMQFFSQDFMCAVSYGQ